MAYLSEEENYLAEAQRKAKQTFLREEVLQAGLPVDEFTQYLETKRGADIDIWTLKELEECVREFKSRVKHLPSKHVFPKDSPSSKIDYQEAAYLPPDSEEAKAEDLPEDTSDQETTYTYTTTQLGENDLTSLGALTVKISDPEIINKGMFSSKYALYSISTEPTGWTVKRRYNDFLWLDEVLTSQFPLNYKPPLPGKKRTGKFETELLEKRRMFLTSFMNGVLRNPQLRRSQYVLAFLKEQEDKVFTIVQKQAGKEKDKKKGGLNAYYTLAGEAYCDSRFDVDFSNKINEYLSRSEILKSKLEKESEIIVYNMKVLAKSIFDFTTSVEELIKIQDLNLWVGYNQGASNKDLYTSIHQAFKNWGDLEVDRSNTVKNTLEIFYTYNKKELKPIKEILKETQTHGNNYKKGKEKLKELKEKLFKLGDIKKWDLEDPSINEDVLKKDKTLAFRIMCAKENIRIRHLRHTYAFYNGESHKELERVIKDTLLLDNLHFEKFADEMNSRAIRLSEIWSSLKESISKQREQIPARALISVS